MEAAFLHKTEYLSWGIALIPLLPLAGFLFNGLGWIVLRDKMARTVVNVVAVAVVAAAFAAAVYFFLFLRAHPDAYVTFTLFEWINAGSVQVPFTLVFDRLSAVMCLVVTGVGGIIHLYSTGYMAHDKSFARYFAYLNLFTFAMLLLVMSKNIVLMFVGWEGVGLCSYLLIGFWYEDDEKASAGKKAFIVNRIGDFGFLIGIFTIFYITSRLGKPTLDFYELAEVLSDNSAVFAKATLLSIPVATFIGISLFVGAAGKSAQIPLYVWLPDAMAGPTPVSAFIHAATMVTAGVYMIGRLNFIYFFSPTALMVVAGVGVVTALFSATIGFTQNDIKKVLAYSTVSQLGFMFTAMGVAAYAAGIFHLTTHAFFKALLFLGAGSVIHGMSGEQDMRFMGGLKKKMPITYWTMFMAFLTIAGIAPFAGFISKDEILWKVFSNDLHPEAFSKGVYVIGLVAAVCTAIYMTRLIMLTFLTPPRMDEETEKHVHESVWSMWVPLVALAVLSVLGGFLNWPHALGGGSRFSAWLEPMWAVESAAGPGDTLAAAPDKASPAHESAAPEHGGVHAISPGTGHGNDGELHAAAGHGGHHDIEPIEYVLMLLSVALALAAILAVYFLYKRHMDKTEKIAQGFGPLYQASYNKYWVDEIYDYTVVEPIKRVSYFFLFKIVDAAIVDGIVNGAGGLSKWLGDKGKLLQNGVAGTYALWIILGLLAILVYFFGLR